jgi:hypothetical protein
VNARRHGLLLAIVLLDLAFVQATSAIALAGMLPLWILALLSPWLRGLQRFALCRGLWNVGVLALFALLAWDADATGLANLLDDGLLLAALCQVHLINNVGERHRPDLLFLNSLLIVFVASCFGGDAAWFGLFALHGVLFVPALQARVRALGDGGAAGPTTGPWLRPALAVAAVTVLVFALWPRDFAREGWLGTLAVPGFGPPAGIGDRLHLGERAPAPHDGRIVMQITPLTPAAAPPAHWRSVALTALVDDTFVPQNVLDGRRLATDPPWTNHADGIYRRPPPADGDRFRVTIAARDARRLPVPLAASELQLEGGRGLVVDPRPYGVLAVARLEGATEQQLAYRVRCATGLQPQRVAATARNLLTFVPDGELAVRARALLAQCRADGVDARDPERFAADCADWLASRRRYRLPGEPGFAASFAAFLAGDGDGHCEYFAAALALLLRLHGLPCRVIAGYLATERAADGTIVVRAAHAHAWVEALRDDGTWQTLDATPAAAAGAGADATRGLLPLAWVRGLWDAVAGFDAAGRDRLLGLFADLLLPATVLLALLGGASYLRRRRRPPPAVVALLHAVRATGLARRPGETPRELLARARATDVADERVAALGVAITRHEHARYRKHPEVNR